MKTSSGVRFLLSHLFSKDLFELEDLTIKDRLLQNLDRIIMEGIPPQYVVAKTDFREVELLVAPEVFIPRPETEILFELVAGIREYHLALEVGIGAGPLSIGLLSRIPDLFMVGTEISIPAIEVCISNLIHFYLDDRMQIIICQSLDSLRDNVFDLVIANLPYIPTTELEKLPRRVRYEPRIALDGGDEGISVVKPVVDGAIRVLKDRGIIGLEIDPAISRHIPVLFKKLKRYSIHQDYAGLDRYVIGEK